MTQCGAHRGVALRHALLLALRRVALAPRWRADGAPAACPSRSIEAGSAATQCVEPTDVHAAQPHGAAEAPARRHRARRHARRASYSLKDCIDCHASRETGSVAAARPNFCDSCHSYAAVKLDCFECHASKPATPAGTRAARVAPASRRHAMSEPQRRRTQASADAAGSSAWPRPASAGVVLAPGVHLIEIAQAAAPRRAAGAQPARCAGAC